MDTPQGPHGFYDGSTFLKPLSDVSGISIDKINFVVCQLSAVLFGFPFRILLGPHLVRPAVRHITEITGGLVLAYFCFGKQTMYLIFQSCMTLIILRFVPARLIGTTVLALNMTHLYVCHVLQMYYDYGGSTLDIVWPLMIATQRMTSLAFGVQDGLCRYSDEDTEMVQKYRIDKQPSLLEFFSYAFYFHGLLCGPFCFYNDYIAFIDGTNYMPKMLDTSQSDDDMGQSNHPPQSDLPPHPEEHLAMRLLSATIFGLLSILIHPFISATILTGVEFKVRGFFMKCFLMILLPFFERHKYYAAWKLAEAANISCGLGFNGYHRNGCANWDLINNVNILRVELATSPKMFLDNFNITTMNWLRYVVYDRWHSKAVVIFFSASWYGFYAGYYLSALTLLLVLLAAQKLRRFVNPCGCGCPSNCGCGVVAGPFESAYDVITFLVTSFCMPYVACPFMIRQFEPAFAFYSDVYFWVQVLCVGLFYAL